MSNEKPSDPVPPSPEIPESGPRHPRPARREQAACDALRTFVRDLHQDRFGTAPPRLEEGELVLKMKARPGEDWALRFDPPLSEQLETQLDDWQASRDIYREGRVYCFRCDTSECEHARPFSPLEVFKEYAPNGIPEWHELAQALLAGGDERAERLYREGGGLVALFQPGRLLRGKQLSSFGRSSRTYAILAQVASGFFPAPEGLSPEGGQGSRLAISFQAVEVRGPRGERILRLNPVTRGDVAGLRESLTSGWQPALYRAWKTAEQEMEYLERAAREAGAGRDGARVHEVMRRLPGIMRRLAESLERGGRQESRRTHHVERRRHEHRPVHKALEDAQAAAPGLVFDDEKAGTTVACGPQSRAHAFNRDGRHVTSFVLRPQAIDLRVRTRRWRVLAPDEVAEFKRRIAQYVPAQKDMAPPLSR
ncbi:MAG TPA: hypothetical protein P5567_05685 [Kiritimatiellia bacterium]|nr:hypothetical protein [Kiritimatiellia bacterium]HRZ11929.1 hypothetical protein [Kiritimatiellia bacterium]HSA17265.1 hypothetical protein [Kiritimatiellia bacterium]